MHAKAALEQPASPRWHEHLAVLALHSPGNIAYRALARICDEIDQELRKDLWRAAARLANGIRTLFNRMDVMFLLDQLYGTARPYWRSVLQYCAAFMTGCAAAGPRGRQSELDLWLSSSPDPCSPVSSLLGTSLGTKRSETPENTQDATARHKGQNKAELDKRYVKLRLESRPVGS